MPDGPSPAQIPATVPEPTNGKGRDEETVGLLRLIADRATPEVHLTIADGAFPVTIAEGAVRSETTVEAEERPLMRTVLDRDPKTNAITGSHEEPL
jgi:hypothetical protein